MDPEHIILYFIFFCLRALPGPRAQSGLLGSVCHLWWTFAP